MGSNILCLRQQTNTLAITTCMVLPKWHPQMRLFKPGANWQWPAGAVSLLSVERRNAVRRLTARISRCCQKGSPRYVEQVRWSHEIRKKAEAMPNIHQPHANACPRPRPRLPGRSRPRHASERKTAKRNYFHLKYVDMDTLCIVVALLF